MFRLILTLMILIHGLNVTYCQYSKNPYPWTKSNNERETIEIRFQVPDGFKRVKIPNKSFSHWLRGLPLLPKGTPVKDYTGRVRVFAHDTTLAEVVDYDIKGKKLEQCIDILIRWRAEYLYSLNYFQDIAFYLPGEFLLKWNDWMRGLRPEFQGIKVNLKKIHPPDSSRPTFEEYLHEIFYYSYTQTAYISYPQVNPGELQIGDFMVKKGSRGHAIMIMDMAEDSDGKKILLIGHGDSPARQFYLLNSDLTLYKTVA